MYTKIDKACKWWNKLDLSSGIYRIFMNSATANFIDGIQFRVAAASSKQLTEYIRDINLYFQCIKILITTDWILKYLSKLKSSCCFSNYSSPSKKNTPRSVLGTKGRLLWHWSQSHVFWGDFRRHRFWLKHFPVKSGFSPVFEPNFCPYLLFVPSWELTYHLITYKGTTSKRIFLFPRWDMDSFPEGSIFCLSSLLLQIHLKFNNLHWDSQVQKVGKIPQSLGRFKIGMSCDMFPYIENYIVLLKMLEPTKNHKFRPNGIENRPIWACTGRNQAGKLPGFFKDW